MPIISGRNTGIIVIPSGENIQLSQWTLSYDEVQGIDVTTMGEDRAYVPSSLNVPPSIDCVFTHPVIALMGSRLRFFLPTFDPFEAISVGFGSVFAFDNLFVYSASFQLVGPLILTDDRTPTIEPDYYPPMEGSLADLILNGNPDAPVPQGVIKHKKKKKQPMFKKFKSPYGRTLELD